MEDFIDFARANGLILNSVVIGKITRCPTEDKPRKKNGAYYFSGFSGWIRNFRQHDYTLHWKTEQKIDPVRLARMKEKEASRKTKAYQEQQINAARAAETAKTMLGQSELSVTMYTVIKGFPSLQCNVWKDETDSYILIPMYYKGDLVSLQKISTTGEKKFLFGRSSKECYYKIGQGGRTFLTEGWITGVTAHHILNQLHVPHNIVICFSAYNLLEMSKQYKNGFVIADNDLSGTGERVAKQSGLPYYLPENSECDLNDEYLIKGNFLTMQRLRRAICEQG